MVSSRICPWKIVEKSQKSFLQKIRETAVGFRYLTFDELTRKILMSNKSDEVGQVKNICHWLSCFVEKLCENMAVFAYLATLIWRKNCLWSIQIVTLFGKYRKCELCQFCCLFCAILETMPKITQSTLDLGQIQKMCHWWSLLYLNWLALECSRSAIWSFGINPWICKQKLIHLWFGPSMTLRMFKHSY